MKKPFNVTRDMDVMTHDQLKGAVYNMESIANAMYVTLQEMLKEYEGDPDYWTVLSFDPEAFGSIRNIYLPSTDGRDVIISADRLDSLMDWKLRFFKQYGNLNLVVKLSGRNDVTVSITLVDNVCEPGARQYVNDRLERSRSDAALYESMSSIKKF